MASKHAVDIGEISLVHCKLADGGSGDMGSRIALRLLGGARLTADGTAFVRHAFDVARAALANLNRDVL